MADQPLGFVADTNVVSNRGDFARNPNLIEWLRQYAGLVRLSVITVAEMRRGLLLLEGRIAGIFDPKVRTRELSRFGRKRAWYEELTQRFADRIEPIDLAVAEKWAEISVRFPSLRDADKAIAATALAREYGVATENLGDFSQTGVVVVNPFDPASWNAGPDNDPLSRLSRS